MTTKPLCNCWSHPIKGTRYGKPGIVFIYKALSPRSCGWWKGDWTHCPYCGTKAEEEK